MAQATTDQQPSGNTLVNGTSDAAPMTNGTHRDGGPASSFDTVEVLCGPLLNYKGLSDADTATPIWSGSVLIVTKPTKLRPTLHLRKLYNEKWREGELTATDDKPSECKDFAGVLLYSDPNKAFFAFPFSLPLGAFPARWEYQVSRTTYLAPDANGADRSRHAFAVPSSTESMRIMFHSCNGFSIGTDMEKFKGPNLWKDVLRHHQKRPFHVMIGGGDQIYNDPVRTQGPLKEWTEMRNPHKRREYAFDEPLRAACDKWYFENYSTWYASEPFCSANAEIPQINVWDDHDIIDGFGSYTDHFMQCGVFRGIGGVAFKYYCLFQHHIPPPKLSFVSDDPSTHRSKNNADLNADHPQLKDTFILSDDAFTRAQCFILGKQPGPYVEDVSRSLYMRLGKRIAFVGLDARTERTRHQVNYESTYDLFCGRADQELTAANGAIRHLIVLLGVPIAYPRLVWLETIFNSPLIGGVRFLNKRFGVAEGLFNTFDGNVDLLDDLDDHYTARTHKKERKNLIQRFQELAKKHHARITILGGDVHLAAFGRFYSKPKLGIKPEHDHRYMANVISSAITNKPPPSAIANLLARRNFIHHFDHHTDETLVNCWDHDPGELGQRISRTASNNKCTLPSRNYAILSEAALVSREVAPTTNNLAAVSENDFAPVNHVTTAAMKTPVRDAHNPITRGEANAGSKHQVADGFNSGPLAGGLDVTYRIEIDSKDVEGHTEGYGISIPMLLPASTATEKPDISKDAIASP